MAKGYRTKGRVTRSAGRFGTRYGRKDRKLIANIEEQMHKKHRCSNCARVSVRRTGTGIWECTKCGHTFAGGTYTPQTSVGKTVPRAIRKAIEEEVE